MSPPRVRVDLGVMTIKENCTFLRSPELEPYQLMHFYVIPRTPLLCVCGWPSWLDLQNTPTASLQRCKTLPMSVLI